MANFEFEVYVKGNIETFEKNYDLFDDGTLAIIAGSMIIMFNREAETIGAAIDSAVKNIESCGGKALYIDLAPGTLMLTRGRTHEYLKGK